MGLINWFRKKIQGFDDEVAARRPAAPTSTHPPTPPPTSFETARERVTDRPRHRLAPTTEDSTRRRQDRAEQARRRRDDDIDGGGVDAVAFMPYVGGDDGDSGRHHSPDTGSHYYTDSSPATSSYDGGSSYGGGSYGGDSSGSSYSGGGDSGGGSF